MSDAKIDIPDHRPRRLVFYSAILKGMSFAGCITASSVAALTCIAMQLWWSAAYADSTLPNPSLPGNQKQIAYLTLDAYPDLCEAIVAQMNHVLSKDEDLCIVPYEDKSKQITMPDWKPMDPIDARDLLKWALPQFGWETIQIEKKILQELGPGATWVQVREEFWQRYSTKLIAALKSDPRYFETALINVDNIGDQERVYRVAVLHPATENDPNDHWTARSCSDPKVSKAIPAYSIIFDEEDRQKLGTLSKPMTLDHKDLFIYRGKTYVASPSLASSNIDWIKTIGAAGPAYRETVCIALTKFEIK